jgi:hypothetical protein
MTCSLFDNAEADIESLGQVSHANITSSVGLAYLPSGLLEHTWATDGLAGFGAFDFCELEPGIAAQTWKNNWPDSPAEQLLEAEEAN